MERVEISRKRICMVDLARPDVCGEVFESSVPFRRWRVLRVPWNCSLCVPASPPVVLVLTVLFSDVNVVCEVVFSGSDCESVEPQTCSLSTKKAKRVWLWSVRQRCKL